MAVYVEGKGIAEAEPFGLLTEGAAGIATIVCNHRPRRDFDSCSRCDYHDHYRCWLDGSGLQCGR